MNDNEKEYIIKKWLESEKDFDRPLGEPQPCIGVTTNKKWPYDCSQKQDCLRYELSLTCKRGWTLLAPVPDCKKFIERRRND